MTDITTGSVHGSCAEEHGALRELLAANLASGTDLGASIALVRDGRLVVDLWGGEARPGIPWTTDTLVQVWSVSKVMAGLVVLVLVDRGELDLDAPVASYWPEFGAGGKEAVTVSQLLGHSSGLPGWREAMTVEDLVDLERSEAWLARAEPWYPPGDGIAYQVLNHGHLLDGLVRGMTGRPLAELLHSEVLPALGADGGFFLGVPTQRLGDCADLVMAQLPAEPPGPAPGEDSLTGSTLLNPFMTAEVCNAESWRRSAVGGLGGHGTARGIALAQAAVSCGSPLLGQETVDRIWASSYDGVDRVLNVPLSFSLGYGLPHPTAPAIPEGRVCWWTGWGGSVVVNDADRRTTFVYATRSLQLDHIARSARTDAYVRAALGD